MTLHSQVLISTEIEATILALEACRTNETIVEIVSPAMATVLKGEDDTQACAPYVHRIVTEKETFGVEDAKLAIEKAYMASQEVTVILLAAKLFSSIVQNKLLKVLEEPPAKKEFILLSSSKATILDTIRSRLPVSVLSEQKSEAAVALNLAQLSLGTVYEFVQTHKRTDAKVMKALVEDIAKEAMVSGHFDLDEKTLQLMSNAFMALDVGSPPAFVLNTLLLKLLARKKR